MTESTPFFKTSLFSSQNPTMSYTKLKDLLDEHEASVVSSNNRESYFVNKKVKIILDGIKKTDPGIEKTDSVFTNPMFSSRHIVFFGTMTHGEETKKICIKFEKHPEEKITDDYDQHKAESYMIKNFTQKHASYVMHNYDALNNHLNKLRNNSSTKITVNTVYCCSVENHTFWIEDRLDNFTTFYNTEKLELIDKILTTSEKVLEELQKFIYNDSGYAYTVIDLQGEHDTNSDSFVLCDVEFTFASVYDFEPFMLLSRIQRLYGLEAITIKMLSDQIKNVEQRMGNIEERMGNIEERMGNMEQKMGKMEQKMGNIEEKMGNMEQKMDDMEQKMDNIQETMKQILQKLDKKN